MTDLCSSNTNKTRPSSLPQTACRYRATCHHETQFAHRTPNVKQVDEFSLKHPGPLSS